MLRELRIHNVAIIDNLEIEFGPGLNVITGETGAGKSILIGALEWVVGAKLSPKDIRTGEDNAWVEAVFDISGMGALRNRLDELGLPLENLELIMRRQLSSSGRSRALVNGATVSNITLLELYRHLLDIHGQHQHQALLHAEHQLILLDAYGGLTPLRLRVEEAYEKLSQLRQLHKELVTTRDQRRQRQELLQFQSKEIESAHIRPGELEDLNRERRQLIHAERLAQLAQGAYDALYAADRSLLGELSATIRMLG